jgi:5-methylcytosine-specific restriction endonuclease McrA
VRDKDGKLIVNDVEAYVAHQNLNYPSGQSTGWICRGCGSTRKSHYGGVCSTCWHREWYRLHPEQVIATRTKHKEHRNEYSREYFRTHRKESAVRSKRYRERNKEALAIINRLRRIAFRRKIQDRSNRWRKENPEKKSAQDFRRKALKVGNGGSHTGEEWIALRNKAEGICQICRKYVGSQKLTHDHIIPLTKGGTDNIDNLQPVCHSCNSKKSNTLPPPLENTTRKRRSK